MSSLMLRVRNTVAFAIVAVLALACGGSSPTQVGGGTGNPPPTKDEVSFRSVLPLDGAQFTAEADVVPTAKVSFVVDAVSSLTGSPVNSISYKLDGSSLSTNLNVPVLVGKHTVCATAATSTASAEKCWTVVVMAPVIVTPTVTIVGTVTVRTFTGERCPVGEYIVVSSHSSSTRDSVMVNSTGNCAFTWTSTDPYWVAQSSVVVEAKGDPSALPFHAHVDRKYFIRLEVLTLERRSVIPMGQFKDFSQEADLDKCYALSGDSENSSFCRRGFIPSTSKWEFTVANFPTYPVNQAFCRDLSDETSTAEDSTGFARQSESVTLAIGNELFRFGGDPSDPCQKGIGRRLYVNAANGKGAVSNVNSFRVSDFTSAWLDFGLEAAISDRYTVLHETFHTLGFGHTCGWKSIMASAACPKLAGSEITQDDVFYFYVMQTMADGRRLHKTPFGLAEVWQGQRIERKEDEYPVSVPDQ